mmetsp:Transcript_10875/g.14550  ORF Transcript_10875/g.14550 Transcript_10875/m.14550 type:complete len:85 (+) Transcript_10875:88-342(+)
MLQIYSTTVTQNVEAGRSNWEPSFFTQPPLYAYFDARDASVHSVEIFFQICYTFYGGLFFRRRGAISVENRNIYELFFQRHNFF